MPCNYISVSDKCQCSITGEAPCKGKDNCIGYSEQSLSEFLFASATETMRSQRAALAADQGDTMRLDNITIGKLVAACTSLTRTYLFNMETNKPTDDALAVIGALNDEFGYTPSNNEVIFNAVKVALRTVTGLDINFPKNSVPDPFIGIVVVPEKAQQATGYRTGQPTLVIRYSENAGGWIGMQLTDADGNEWPENTARQGHLLPNNVWRCASVDEIGGFFAALAGKNLTEKTATRVIALANASVVEEE